MTLHRAPSRGRSDPAAPEEGGREAELMREQVETGMRPCTTMTQLYDELIATRRRLASAAENERVMTIRDLVAPALLGAATGLRSQLGMAALLTSGDLSHLPRPWSCLGTRRARVMAQVAAGGELVADKLPTAPPRTEPGPLVARIATGATVGLLADAATHGRLRARSAVAAALLGGSAAAATSWIGQRARTRLSEHVPPLAVAAAEDVLAITLAVLGTRCLPAMTGPNHNAP